MLYCKTITLDSMLQLQEHTIKQKACLITQNKYVLNKKKKR